MLENAAQRTRIALAKGLEDALGGPRESIGLGLRVVAEELGAEHRGQGQGDDGGDENGDAEGDGEFPEEAPHDVAHEEKGDEHGDEGDGQGENGEADLPRALEGRLQRRVARLDVAGDVLDHDHRVVDHEARGDGEGHQREVVQAEAQRVHDGEGADDRDGHGHARDEGGGGAAQEQEDDEHHEDHGEHELELDVVDRGANGGGAVRQHRDLHGGGQRALELRQELLHAIDHLDEVGPRLSLDIDDDGRTGAHPRRLPEVLGVVHGVGDVGEEHGGAVAVGDDERPVESTRHELIVGPDGIGLLGAVQAALGLVHVRRRHRLPDVVQGQSIGGQARRIRLDADGGLLSAAQGNEPHAGKLRHLGHQSRVGEVFDGSEGKRVRRQSKRQDRCVGRIHLAIHGRIGQILGQERRGGVHGRLHLLLGDVEGQAQVELERDHRARARARGRHLLEAGHLTELPLEGRCHRGGHDVRAGPGIEGLHLDGRVVDLGQGGDGEEAIGDGAGQDDGQGQEGGGDRPQDERPRQVHAPDLAGGRSRLVGSTRERSCTLSAPSTMTASPALSPSRTGARPPSVGPSATLRSSTVLSGRTT